VHVHVDEDNLNPYARAADFCATHLVKLLERFGADDGKMTDLVRIAQLANPHTLAVAHAKVRCRREFPAGAAPLHL
jgi:hypothetical protein